METTIKETGENPLNEFQLKALKEAEENLEKLRTELEGKKYSIDLKKEDIILLEKFNRLDAPWKFTECLGIVEVEKSLNEAVKSGKLNINAIAIEAIYYYLSKVEGKGKTTNTETFKDIFDYIRVLKGITNGMESVKADTEKYRNAEFVLAARREGIDTDKSSEEEK